MTLELLEQYTDLRKEVADLASRCERAKERVKTRSRAVVQASAAEYPYVKHSVTVKGYDLRRMGAWGRLERLYRRRYLSLMLQLEEIEAWLGTVEDSKVRQIVRHHYIDGKTWAAAARRVYGHPCEDAARMRVQRYFNKIV